MELFQVQDKSNNNSRVAGFLTKKEAKTHRDELQAKTKSGMPDEKQNRGDSNLWAYSVGYGKDHRLFQKA